MLPTGRGPSRRPRRTLDDLIETLPADLQVAHGRLLTLRNKEIGHSVAGFGGQVVNLYRIAEHNEIGVNIESTLYDRELLDSLQRITLILRGGVGARIDALRFKPVAERAGRAGAVTHDRRAECVGRR